MLQRAASNAYSWWWASHIRTKQSKWLDNNLEEMEGRVKSMLKIIEEDADSFAKRAEMYYRRRPEIISFVEEAYRAYRALAERYDHISGELHKANHTIATAFPDEVQYAMLDEEDDNFPKAITPIDSRKIHKTTIEGLMDKRRENGSAIKKTKAKSITSHMSKEKAQEEINKLQKRILVLQTEKEFIKSSYESGIAKYWEIEKQITDMQEEVYWLQDEFNASAVIEDDEARALMTAQALKSCEDAIVNLQEQRKRSMDQAKIESKRIKTATEKLKALTGETGPSQMELANISNGYAGMSSATMTMEEEDHALEQERLELQSLLEKVKEHFEMSLDNSVEEMAEKIDELVNKIIDLELTVSSQTAQIERLSSQNNELEKVLQSLEEEKNALISGSNELSDRLKQAEEELDRIQALEKAVKDEGTILRTSIMQACRSLHDISEILQSPKHQDQVNFTGPSLVEEIPLSGNELQEESGQKEVEENHDIKVNSLEEDTRGDLKDNPQSGAGSLLEVDSEKIQDVKQEVEFRQKDSSQADDSIRRGSEQVTQHGEQEDFLNLQLLLSSGLEGREKILLAEYTSILRNYKETKKRLAEVEKKNQDHLYETMATIGELKDANAMKDEEIRSLRLLLSSLEMSSDNKGNAVAHSVQLEGSGHGQQKHESMPGISTIMTEGPTPPRHPETPKDRNIVSISKVNTSTDGGSPHVEDLKFSNLVSPQSTSSIEDKFRRDIDALLEENLEFWLRFRTSFHRIREFQATFQDLHAEIEKLKDSTKRKGTNGAMADQVAKPESAPIDKKLRALKTELQIWLEQNAMLRGELQHRFSSLCSIQDEISGVLKASLENEEIQFTPYQAAKFQGEVLNMQQENNQVGNELQAGLDHVNGLQAEVEKALSNLHENFERSGSKTGRHQFRHFPSRTRVPLRSFLFGSKPKRPSLFACVNPALQKQYSDMRSPT